MRILLLSPRPFYPANTGGRIRSSKLVEQLARWHELTIACFESAQDDPAQFERMRAACARLERVPWHETPRYSAAFYTELATSLPSPLPYTVRKYRSEAMQERLRSLLRETPYDLLVCDFLQPAINCLDLPIRPKVLFEHNVEAMIRARQATHAESLAARIYFRQDAWKLARFEARAAKAFDHCIMVSEDDCRTMADAYGVHHTSAIPIAVDTDYFRPRPEDEGEAPELVFLGSMDWMPNQDAVSLLASEILPRVRRQVPATLTVVGRNPPASVQALAEQPGITITGTVPDVRPFLARAHLVVVPLRFGGGTRIKIFEAMAMGRAVVSTTIGAEGLPVTDGRDIALADGPERFAEVVVSLLRDRATRVRLGDAARQQALDGYSWTAAAAAFSSTCEALVERTRAAATSTRSSGPPSPR